MQLRRLFISANEISLGKTDQTFIYNEPRCKSVTKRPNQTMSLKKEKSVCDVRIIMNVLICSQQSSASYRGSGKDSWLRRRSIAS